MWKVFPAEATTLMEGLLPPGEGARRADEGASESAPPSSGRRPPSPGGRRPSIWIFLAGERQEGRLDRFTRCLRDRVVVRAALRSQADEAFGSRVPSGQHRQ